MNEKYYRNMLRVIYESAKQCFIALGRETAITMMDQNAQNAAIHIEAGPPDNVRLDDSRGPTSAQPVCLPSWSVC